MLRVHPDFQSLVNCRQLSGPDAKVDSHEAGRVEAGRRRWKRGKKKKKKKDDVAAGFYFYRL